MKQELSTDLMRHVRMILDGDVLNMPLMHRTDFEKVVCYCLGLLQEKRKANLAYIEKLEDRIVELETAPKLEAPSKGKWKRS